MAWTRDKLTDVEIRAAKPAERLRKFADGKGLQLWVTRMVAAIGAMNTAIWASGNCCHLAFTLT